MPMFARSGNKAIDYQTKLRRHSIQTGSSERARFRRESTASGRSDLSDKKHSPLSFGNTSHQSSRRSSVIPKLMKEHSLKGVILFVLNLMLSTDDYSYYKTSGDES